METLQRTFSIVKPDAVAKGATGDILHMMQENGFRVIGMKMLEINKQQAEGFYAVHASRPFFDSLTTFMSSGPIVVLALEKTNAIADMTGKRAHIPGRKTSTTARITAAANRDRFTTFCLG